MHLSPALLVAAIALVGFLCQWAAWRIRLPAILLLLLAGVLLGPVGEILDPNELLGNLLFPVVSLSVAIILFEGSLTLRFSELSGLDAMVRRLVSVGAVFTWLSTSFVAHKLFGFDPSIALLFGSLVVVTGPTVIMPMLRTIRPNKNISNVLRWEGIVIDPIGALLAVAVYEYLVASGGVTGVAHSLVAFFKIIAIGTVIGCGVGYLLGVIMRRRWLPEYLQAYGTVALVLAAFTVSNAIEHESGLLTVTLMGIVIANMRGVHIEEILSFKENLTVLLISALFILLAARVDIGAVFAMGWPALILLLVMQFVIRPLSVFLCGIGTKLTWQEKSLIAWIGPRGIVAAAVSGLFALKLEQQGISGASDLVGLTFFIIVGTVLLQSATSRPLANLLKVSEPSSRGALIIGANHVARAIGLKLQDNGFTVLLADSNYDHVSEARLAGLPTFYGNPVSEYADRKLDLTGLGRMLGISAKREENVITSLRYRHTFGRDNIFALKTNREAIAKEKESISHAHKGQFIGSDTLNFADVSKILKTGGKLKTTELSEEYNYESFVAGKTDQTIPLFAIDLKEHLRVFNEGGELSPKAGWKIISLEKAEQPQVPAPKQPALPE